MGNEMGRWGRYAASSDAGETQHARSWFNPPSKASTRTKIGQKEDKAYLSIVQLSAPFYAQYCVVDDRVAHRRVKLKRVMRIPMHASIYKKSSREHMELFSSHERTSLQPGSRASI